MTFVVTDNCIKCKYMDCVEVCPVDCFYEGERDFGSCDMVEARTRHVELGCVGFGLCLGTLRSHHG
jgi:NAD-dependent dihydropyrimidine dehydrogenase PreA subunit